MANVEEHYHGNRPQRKWPNQAALIHRELRKLGEQNPEWVALVSAAQDTVTAMDTIGRKCIPTWLPRSVKLESSSGFRSWLRTSTQMWSWVSESHEP